MSIYNNYSLIYFYRFSEFLQDDFVFIFLYKFNGESKQKFSITLNGAHTTTTTMARLFGRRTFLEYFVYIKRFVLL